MDNQVKVLLGFFKQISSVLDNPKFLVRIPTYEI